MKRYTVKLSEEEEEDLPALTHKKGTCGVRKLRRAQMLMMADERLTDERIARALETEA